ncbi:MULTISPECIES: NAD(+) diphosphatase [Vibrio]|uniref:NAD-capped RNA hydrolase NudC n=1 Tax=Vibrio casei TaxID=673372 RepID=A0A368LHL9_9VIBR|nr:MULTISPECIES: NAD(+) diphosphatase [Vibrio]RCS69270.1 NAD(+) diphosphatase [Vibrio casei]SJN38231.1 NADH pyrophosphatase [Vibrio casei]HBV76197.1 NAD(+) diphosphatase [Vibrio sp.]
MLKKDQKVNWCIVDNSTLHLQDKTLPYETAEALNLPIEHAIYIGELDGQPCYWLNASDLDDELEMTPLRELLTESESLFLMASRAIQYGHMASAQRFCNQCGGRNHLNHNQLSMQCADCRTLHYPRIFPCIIVAIKKDNQILLAQHARHTSGMHTVIAGFVEVGETLEQCVAREIKEETGIEVANIRYFGSQPWAFPSSMMVAFLADYAGGEILVDKEELSSAGWFNKDTLPPVAPKGTIARALIEHTLNTGIVD